NSGIIQSSEELVEGGFDVSLVESVMIAKGLGVDITLQHEIATVLFTETQSRYLVTVKAVDAEEFEALSDDCIKLSKVTNDEKLTVQRRENNLVIQKDIKELRELWTSSIKLLLKSN